jgi:uncharacterized protein (DUF58 family)
VRSVAPQRPTAGQTLTVRLLVANPDARASRAITITEHVGATPYPVRLPALDAHAKGVVTYEIPAVPRGRLPVRRDPVVRSDPLGLVRTAVLPGDRGEIRVLPGWHPEVVPLPARAMADGLAETGLPRGDVVFHSLRDYRLGDPARLIHWPATARRGGSPVVRELTDDGEPVQVLLLDTTASAYGADGFEEAVRIVASLAMAAWRDGLGLEVHSTADGELVAIDAADRSSIDSLAILDPLCDVRQSAPAAGSRLAAAIDELADTVPTQRSGAVLGVVTGRSNAAGEAASAQAAAVFEAVYLIRVGAQLAPIAAAGLAHLDVTASRDFAAAAGARWAP